MSYGYYFVYTLYVNTYIQSVCVFVQYTMIQQSFVIFSF